MELTATVSCSSAGFSLIDLKSLLVELHIWVAKFKDPLNLSHGLQDLNRDFSLAWANCFLVDHRI